MQWNLHFQYVLVCKPLPPPLTLTLSHCLKHTHAANFWLAEQSEILLLTFALEKKEKVNSTKYAFLKQITFFFKGGKKKYLAGTHPSEHVFLRMHACTHTPLLKADLRQYFSFNNANKHLYCFVWWMAWFMRKTSDQQYFCCRIPGDSERADCRGEEEGTPQPGTWDRGPAHTAPGGEK